MKPSTPFFVGARLTEAREARGLSVAALAEVVDISRETIYQLESGKIKPSPALYNHLQSALRMPAAYFFDPVADEESSGQVLFRSLASTAKTDRLRAKQRLRWLERVTVFLQASLDLPAFDIPDFGFSSDPTKIDDEMIEAASIDLRARWKLGIGPIGNMAWLLENHGIIVAREDLIAVGLDAAFMRKGDRTFVMLGSDKGALVRSRMDAAHELGHVVIHMHCAEPANEKDPLHKLMEQQAFRFAGAFLLPAEGFSQDVWAGTIDEFLALKPKWQVAVSAMMMRARHLELISEAQIDRLWRLYNGRVRRWRYGEPFDDQWIPEQPLLLRRSFELLLSERVVSVDNILSEIRLSPTDIEDLAGLPRGTLSDGTTPIAFRQGAPGRERVEDNIVPFDRVSKPRSV